MAYHQYSKKQTEEALRTLRGKLPEGKYKKIESALSSGDDSALTERDLHKKMEYFEKNPSHRVGREHTESVREAFDEARRRFE